MTDWVTIKEAVDILGLTERTIRRHVSEGKIASRLENGRRVVRINGHVNNAGEHDNHVENHEKHANRHDAPGDGHDETASQSRRDSENPIGIPSENANHDNPVMFNHDRNMTPEKNVPVNHVAGHDSDMLSVLLKEKDARIKQLEAETASLREQLAQITKTLQQIQADSEATKERSDTIILQLTRQIDQLTEHNQLLLEDKRPKRRWYHRLLVWNNA